MSSTTASTAAAGTTRELTLYGYFRSSASARVRTLLALHGVAYTYTPVDLLKGEQRAASFAVLNPSGTVPALVVREPAPDGRVWSVAQCVAIMEYIDETYGGASKAGYMLPRGETEDAARDRSLIRQIVGVLVGDLFPMLTSSTLGRVAAHGLDGVAWAKENAEVYMPRLEALLARTSTNGKFCYSDSLTMADVTFAPQIETVLRFVPDILPKFPTINSIYENVSKIPQFVEADYRHQIDTPADLRAK